MNRQFGRLLLAGVCWGAVASAAPAQSVGSPDDAAAHPSHRLLGGVSDLAGAEDLLALRLHHTHDVQEVQDLVKSLLDNDEYRRMLKDKFNGLNDDDFKSLKETIQKNPQLLDDPKLHDLLKKVEKFKKDGGDLNSLPKETKDSVLDLAKDFIKQNPTDPASSDPMTGGPMSHIPPGASQPAVPPSPPASSDKFSPSPHEASQPNWVTHDLVQGMTGLIKDIDRTPEGEALRTAALQELAKMESSSSSGLADFLKNILSSDQAAWLAHAGKSSSGSGLDGWDSRQRRLGRSIRRRLVRRADGRRRLDRRPGAARRGRVDGRRRGQAASGVSARARPWSPGPWPVRPSQVSTRQDLIRAFEHLAYLLLGPGARSLNHLDVAGRLSRDDNGRAGAADRLAHLYEQARYAPPDEVMPLHELTAARGDLAALAGAAA